MTSNIGTEEGTKPSIGFQGGAREPDYAAHLIQFFRPEFLNRLDEVVTFRPLSQATLGKILDLKMGDLYKRLGEQKLTLALTEAARALILQKGYDPINGARPLQRAIERLLTRPLSAKIVEDAFAPGDTITADAEGERLTFVTARPAVPPPTPAPEPEPAPESELVPQDSAAGGESRETPTLEPEKTTGFDERLRSGNLDGAET
jgi:ATP-dependent Clp protease ATP-binding subunit ClpA